MSGDAEQEQPGAIRPLSHRQTMIWAGQVLDPDVPLYNMAHAFTLEADIDVEAFTRAFDALVAGADALRTVIVDSNPGDGPSGPFQRVLPVINSSLSFIDFTAADRADGADGDDRVDGDDPESWIDDRSRRRFELSERLFDSALLKIGDGRFVWYLNQHHLICDAWSVSLLLARQGELYELAVEHRLDEAEPMPPYADFLEAEQTNLGSKGHQKAIDHWRNKLADQPSGRPEPLVFYGQRPDDLGAETVRVAAEIDGERAERLERFLAAPDFAALSPELTALRFFHTVLFAYLHRIDGSERLVVGTPFHNRAKRQAKQTPGLFMNLYPVVATIADDETMVGLSDKLGAEVFENMQHARFPLGAAEEAEAFEVVLNYLHIPHQNFGRLEAEDRWVHPGAGDRGHSLRWQIRRTDHGFRLFFDVKTALFDGPARAALVDHVLGIIDQWIEDRDIPVGALQMLSAHDHDRLVTDFNRPSGPEVPTTSVVEEFEAMVAANPGAVAVARGGAENEGDGSPTLTYDQLNRRANRVANHLRSSGLAPGDYAGVLLPRSADAVVAILGILKAGGAYLPMEPATPTARVTQMVKDTGARLICTDSDGRAKAETAGAVAVLLDRPGAFAVSGATDAAADAVDDRDEANPTTSPSLDRTAYAIFTSGSTGKPKGVPVHHRGLSNYITWARRQYTEGEHTDGEHTDGQRRSFALFTSLAFDLTITSIFVPLTSGGSIITYPDDVDGGVPPVVEVWRDNRADIVKLTPSHLAIVGQLGLSAPRLEVAIVGGEDLTVEIARTIQDLHPDLAIYNEYGPTETVVGCMIHRFDATADRRSSVPIGRPAANAEILVLDRYGMPVPPGVVGEILIGGPGVTDGYLGRPDLTAERFVPRPDGLAPRPVPGLTGGSGLLYRSGDLGRWSMSDGEPSLEFLGRADDQVKIRGHRIELGEIEAALAAHPAVDTAAVTVVTETIGPMATTTAGAPDAIEHCVRCGLPSNFPDATFTDGVCSLCLDYDTYRPKVEEYFGNLDELAAVAEQIKAEQQHTEYDCVVLLSGGKDSTYMLYQVVALGLKPLVFTLDNGFISPSALANCRRVCDHLGVELVIGSTEHMNEIFRDSLDRFANVCNGCFKTIYTLSMNLAKEHGLASIVTGLARGQLFETRLSDMYNHRIFDVDKIDEYVLQARKAYHLIEDSVSELLDVSAFEDGRIYDEIRFVDFYRYADVGLDEVLGFLAEETPWERPPDTGRSTNCLINDVGIHVHNHERGFHNYALPYSWDVRLGHKQREAAMDELDDDIDQGFVSEVLVEIGYKPKPRPHERETSRLVAHYQGAEPCQDDELRALLAESLPDYMMPASFVHHRQLPLTSNGKVDRARLEGVVGGQVSAEVDLSAMTEADKRAAEVLGRIWGTIFNREVGLGDNFFELGGDSITAIQIVDRAASSGVVLTPRQLFEAQTLAAVAVKATITSDDPAPDSGSGSDSGSESGVSYPLTPTQSGMLFHSLSDPGSGVYEGQIVHHLEGMVDHEVLERCWVDLVGRHDVFRFGFHLHADLDEVDGDEAEGGIGPRQVRSDAAPAPLIHHDWSDRTEDAAKEQLEAFLYQDRERGFDLADGPPVRVALLRLDTHAVLVWSFHHIALDGWSIALAMNELLDSYQADIDGRSWSPPARRPFTDYLHWLAAQDQDRAKRFWTDHLAGFSEPTALPRSLRSGADDAITIDGAIDGADYGASLRHLPAWRGQRLSELAAAERVTVSTVLQAAWALVLARYEGSDDVVFGVTTSGRPASLSEAETMIGMLVTTLPNRVVLPSDQDPGEWLRAIQADQLTVREHEYASLSDVTRWSELPSGQPLFESILVVENFPDHQPPADRRALTIESRDYRVKSNYPLAMIVLPGERLGLKAVYDPNQFDDVRIEHLLDHVEAAIDTIIDGSAATVDQLSIVPEAEQVQLLTWSTGAPLADIVDTADGGPILLPDRIRRWATETPDAVAAVCGPEQVSYGRLMERADTVAVALRAQGAGQSTYVGVLAERSIEMVVAIVGVMEAGAAYIPLDPTYPVERLEFMIDDAGVDLVVSPEDTDVNLPSILPSWSDDRINTVAVPGTGLAIHRTAHGTAHRTAHRTAARSGAEPSSDVADAVPVTADDLAYLIYTSGSTGTPNGVPISHGILSYSTAARFVVYDHQPTSFLLLSSFSFDSSIVGIFWTLAAGGRLVLPRSGEELDMQVLSGLIAEHQVSHSLALPSLYRLLLDYAEPSALASLNTVVVAGEACPRTLIDTHRSVLGDGVALYNEYGPTEAGVWCTVHRCTGLEPGPVPIGRPIPGASVAVVDQTGRPAGIGVPGEIVVAGPGLANGYLNRPELTAERFIERGGRRWFGTRDRGTVTPDGLIEFGGRIDSQIKIRGHRVELGEVEAVIGVQPDVALVVAAVVDGDLVAFVEPDTRSAVAEPDLRSRLLAAVAERLPEPFVPSRVVVVDHLPRLPNGKVDRNQLPEVPEDAGDRERRPPETVMEQRIAEIWAELLPGDGHGIDDDFFEVGGHSLLAVSLVERIRRATGTELPLAALLDTPTIAGLAAAVSAVTSGHEEARAWQCLVPLQTGGTRVPLYLIPPAAGTALSFRAFAANADPDQPLYCFEPFGNDGVSEPHDTVEAMARYYIEELKAAQPDGRYRIGGSCLGAIVAWEMAGMLQEAGTPVELLVFLDPGPPHSGPTWSYTLPSQRSPLALVRSAIDVVTSGELVTAAQAVWRRNRFDRVGRIHYRAQLSYVADRLADVPIIWLESAELAETKPTFLQQWRTLAGDDLTPIIVPDTTHDGLMTGRPDEVARMAELFNRAMADFEAP